MDDTFTFIAPVMPKREIDPFALRLAVGAALFVAFVGAAGAFLVTHERASDARQAALEARIVAQQRAELEAAAPGDEAITLRLDEEARGSAERALALALQVFAGSSSFEAAAPAQLADAQPSLLFVDGRSTSPVVVSVFATDSAWSAAVLGPSGTCYWLRASETGDVSRDTGRNCTGRAAAAAAGTVW